MIKRTLFRVTQVFDYRTFAVAGAFVSVLVAGMLVINSAQTAREALDAQDASRKAASRRIDLLTQQANQRDTRINHLIATVARQQTGMDALTEQIRRMGGQPVVIVRQSNGNSEPAPSPTPRASSPSKPRPTTSPQPQPSASPSPTCRPLPIIGCPGAR